MANNVQPCHDLDPREAKSPSKMLNLDVEAQLREEEKGFDYAKRAQWLRAAVLGANDGLLSTASLMMGVGAVRKDVKSMILTGVAGLVAGACSMAIGEFVSVYSQYDIELAQMKREGNMDQKDKLPNPYYAAFASALAFAVGAGVPLLGLPLSIAIRLGWCGGGCCHPCFDCLWRFGGLFRESTQG
uniref:Vacuolar iron transporter n=1 Tax=Glycine max TaxID=3847 RepID=A0A0R0FW29_SOYBN